MRAELQICVADLQGNTFHMNYRLLGKSGLRVSELCLGTMTFGEEFGWGADRDESHRIFDTFTAAGGNFIDTANYYNHGTSEIYVGECIRSERDALVVASKYTLRRPGADPLDVNGGGNQRKNLRLSVESSLKRLGTDYLDLFYLHVWDWTTPAEEVLRGLDDLVRAGKVLHIGISDSPAWVASYLQAIAELRGWSRLAAYQGEYSLRQRGVESDVLPMTRAMDMSMLAFGMLGGGVLTGKFNRAGGPGEATRAHEATPQELTMAAAVLEVAQECGRSPSQVAINWVRQQSDNIIPVLGARKVSQLVDNLGALDFRLNPEQIERLSQTNPRTPAYPHTFWGDWVQKMIFGEHAANLHGLQE